jgi:tetratricopeptide (TPR) repeat protein
VAVADECLRAGLPRQALPFLLHGLEREPSAYLWTRLGQALRDLGHHYHAASCHRRALELEPENSFALVGQARALAAAPESSTDELVAAVEGLQRAEPTARNAEHILWALQAVIRELGHRTRQQVLSQLASELRAVARRHAQLRSPIDEASSRAERARVLLAALDLGSESQSSGSPDEDSPQLAGLAEVRLLVAREQPALPPGR